MPQQQIVPTWLAWNNCNFPTQSGIQDLRTGQDFPAGGLNRGDYFDATEQEANNASALNISLLHWGRYRLVQVDSGATVANVKTGTVGFMRAGSFVQSVAILTPGSGQTAGIYTVPVPANSGGGSGAVIQVVVGSSGTVTSASVLQGGANYTSVPTVTLTTGGTPGTLSLQLNSTPNSVTSFDQAPAQLRPIVFLNSITPGNYGFVQELGLATVLGKSTITSATIGAWADGTTGGVVDGRASTGTSPQPQTLGQCVDTPVANALFKVVLNEVGVYQD